MIQLLDVYTFQLQKKVKGKYQKEATSFDEIAKVLIDLNPQKSKMAALLQQIVKTFDTSFLLNSDSSKAICFKNVEDFNISEDSNTISGIFLGGNTGQQYDVYNNEDASTVTHIVKPSEVASLPFFFKIWLPKDFNTGVLVVHRYSTNSCFGLFKKNLYELFSSIGFKLNTQKFVPKDKIDEFLENCNIFKIGISWKKGIDNSLKPKVDLLQGNSFASAITGISIPAYRLITDYAFRRKVTYEVSTIYPEYNESLHNLTFYYLDSKGQKASSTIDALECLLPSISLGVTCVHSDNTPNWDEIKKVADIYIELIKKDLKYNAKQQ